MDVKKKAAAVADFKSSSRKPKVLIVSLKAGGVGLNVCTLRKFTPIHPPNNCQLTTANHVFMVCLGILQNSCCSKETRRWIVGGTQRLKIKVATTCELFLRGVLTLGCSNWPGAQDRPGQGCLCKTLHCLWQDLLVIRGRWLPSRLPELSRIGFYRSRSEKPPLSTRPFVVLVVGSLIQKAFKIWR